MEELHPIFKFRSKSSGKDKVLNATGLHHLVVILLTMPIWMAGMKITHWLGDTIEGFDNNRAKFDYTGKIWCRTYLSLTNSYPILEGDVNRLKVGPHGEMSEGACLFVANHASFLDIAVLCTVLDPVFKFIAKDSLKKFPGVGMQLVGVSIIMMFVFMKLAFLATMIRSINLYLYL
jgi:1-acyl-sn-glycerol-3-phosphate acyltransferase